MARIAYECNQVNTNNITNTAGTLRPFSCTDKSCLYCCCNAQCCLLIQRKPPKHFWEAWYFWLGVAVLILFIISSVSNYLLVNYRQSWMTLPFVSGQSIGDSNHRVDDNNISIHVIPIPTTDVTSTTNKKLFLCPPESSVSHMMDLVDPLSIVHELCFLLSQYTQQQKKCLTHKSLAIVEVGLPPYNPVYELRSGSTPTYLLEKVK